MSNGQLPGPPAPAEEQEPPRPPIVVRTPRGNILPSDEYLPSINPVGDAFSALSEFTDSPQLRLGRRGSAQWLTVGTMMEMSHDEIISMSMAWLGAMLVNATYVIECADEQKRRMHADMYEPIHRGLMLNASPALFFGFQGMVKKFGFEVPEPRADPKSVPGTIPTPSWTESVKPLVIKGFEQIHPTLGRPKWNEEDGSFEGIEVTGQEIPVPLTHSFWLTIGKYRAFGDYFGWGRCRSVYSPWWNKYFTLDQRTLYIQRGIDPVVKVRHPSGVHEGTQVPYADYAKAVGDAVRGGSTVTLPSDTWMIIPEGGYGEQPSQVYKWDVQYMINTADPGPLTEIKTDEDKRIAFGMLIPPQSIFEAQSLGLGGPNSAEIMAKMAEMVLIQEAAEIDRHLNEYVFPMINAANYGPDSPKVTKRTTGLNENARRFLEAVFDKLLSRGDVDATIFDVPTMAKGFEIPTRPPQAPPVVPGTTPEGTASPVAAPEIPTQPAPDATNPAKQDPGGAELTTVTPPRKPINTGHPPSIVVHDAWLFEQDQEFFGSADYTDEEASTSLSFVMGISNPGEETVLHSVRYAFNPEQRYLDAMASLEEILRLSMLAEWRDSDKTLSEKFRKMGVHLRLYALHSAQLGKAERLRISTEAETPLTRTERAQVSAWVRQQRRYLHQAYQDTRTLLANKDDTVVIAKTREHVEGTRLPMYAQSVRSQYERLRARFAITRYPRSGDTKCLSNCNCTLSWSQDDDGWLVRWVAHDGAHCADCLALAAASPYREGTL